MQLDVRIIGITRFVDEAAIEATGGVWKPDSYASDGESLTEFAGRNCYQSWDKKNPATRSNANYLAHIEEVGHWSVMEHATASILIRGVSRSLLAEITRHRHFSPSVLSQRFVVLDPDVAVRSKDDFVVPPAFEDDAEAIVILEDAWEAAMDAYERLMERADAITRTAGLQGSMRAKRAREAARCVLPNMTPTSIVLTGNHRAWREMLLKRLQPEADREISRLAEIVFKMLSDEESALYQDLQIVATPEGPSLRKVNDERKG
jgi:thymidylate synthase (FAD)